MSSKCGLSTATATFNISIECLAGVPCDTGSIICKHRVDPLPLPNCTSKLCWCPAITFASAASSAHFAAVCWRVTAPGVHDTPPVVTLPTAVKLGSTAISCGPLSLAGDGSVSSPSSPSSSLISCAVSQTGRLSRMSTKPRKVQVPTRWPSSNCATAHFRLVRLVATSASEVANRGLRVGLTSASNASGDLPASVRM